MKTKVKVILVYEHNFEKPFVVKEVTNSTELTPGKRLAMYEVDKLIDNNIEVKVIGKH